MNDPVSNMQALASMTDDQRQVMEDHVHNARSEGFKRGTDQARERWDRWGMLVIHVNNIAKRIRNAALLMVLIAPVSVGSYRWWNNPYEAPPPVACTPHASEGMWSVHSLTYGATRELLWRKTPDGATCWAEQTAYGSNKNFTTLGCNPVIEVNNATIVAP